MYTECATTVQRWILSVLKVSHVSVQSLRNAYNGIYMSHQTGVIPKFPYMSHNTGIPILFGIYMSHQTGVIPEFPYMSHQTGVILEFPYYSVYSVYVYCSLFT